MRASFQLSAIPPTRIGDHPLPGSTSPPGGWGCPLSHPKSQSTRYILLLQKFTQTFVESNRFWRGGYEAWRKEDPPRGDVGGFGGLMKRGGCVLWSRLRPADGVREAATALPSRSRCGRGTGFLFPGVPLPTTGGADDLLDRQPVSLAKPLRRVRQRDPADGGKRGEFLHERIL